MERGSGQSGKKRSQGNAPNEAQDGPAALRGAANRNPRRCLTSGRRYSSDGMTGAHAGLSHAGATGCTGAIKLNTRFLAQQSHSKGSTAKRDPRPPCQEAGKEDFTLAKSSPRTRTDGEDAAEPKRKLQPESRDASKTKTRCFRRISLHGGASDRKTLRRQTEHGGSCGGDPSWLCQVSTCRLWAPSSPSSPSGSSRLRERDSMKGGTQSSGGRTSVELRRPSHTPRHLTTPVICTLGAEGVMKPRISLFPKPLGPKLPAQPAFLDSRPRARGKVEHPRATEENGGRALTYSIHLQRPTKNAAGKGRPKQGRACDVAASRTTGRAGPGSGDLERLWESPSSRPIWPEPGATGADKEY